MASARYTAEGCTPARCSSAPSLAVNPCGTLGTRGTRTLAWDLAIAADGPGLVTLDAWISGPLADVRGGGLGSRVTAGSDGGFGLCRRAQVGVLG
jgi:hypothetical protein